MKKTNAFALALFALSLGLFLNSPARSDYSEQKIAFVDVTAVVNKSNAVQQLRKEQKTKTENLQKWVNTVKADIQKQKTDEGKEKLAKKYQAELNKKKETINKEYQEKVKVIDKNIQDTIAAQAKAQGYSIVLTKPVVLYGGDDITSAVQKAVK